MLHELPMVTEAEATGTLRTLYAEMRRELPFVPLLFQALAIQPVALSLAWQQTKALIKLPGFAQAARSLGQAALAEAPVVPIGMTELSVARQVALAETARFFAQIGPADALIAAHLAWALGGRLQGKPAKARSLAVARRALPAPALDMIDPEQAPELVQRRFRQVRALLGSPYVPGLWRVLGADPVLLDVVWEHLHLSLPHAHFAARELDVLRTLQSLVPTLRPEVLLTSEALDNAGIGETEPAVRRLLGVFAASALRQLMISATLAKGIPAAEPTTA